MKLIANTKSLFLVLTLSSMTLFFSACSKKVEFLQSSVAPAAEGTVKISKDKNKNVVVKINIINLAEPERLQPARSVYVVWMLTDNDLTKNIGRIKTSRTMFNKRLEGSFETISSFNPAKIFITAEDDADIQYPQQEIVLTTGSL